MFGVPSLYKFFYFLVRKVYKKDQYIEDMAKDALPTLESLVQQVVEKRLAERDFPVKLSTETVRQLHVEVQARYFQRGRTEKLPEGSIKKEVRAYLERQYTYVQEYVDHPFKPRKKMIVSAHYERKKTEE